MGRYLSTESTCDRARTWASLELDGELSELERALLTAHLRSCEECAGFVARLDAVTTVLRAGPLEVRERPLFPVARHPAARGRRVALQVALAAALAGIAVGLGVLAGPLIGGSEEPSPPLSEDVVLVTPTSANQLGLQNRLRQQGATKREDRLFPVRRIRENL
jgi:predicted anti-sigma-YlaC factor YlaD